MVVLTRKAEYGLLAMVFLGRAFLRGEQASSAREIADQYKIPLSVLMNILKRLQRAGLVNSVRGPRGGYLLARPAESVTLDRVIRVIEGPIRVTRCMELPDGADDRNCERSRWCPVRAAAQVIQEKIDNLFREITLADLVSRSYSSRRPVVA
ncbi:MAG: Rrf2 family transcriptional regulator [Phycisphaerae bacterium]|nr:Rrf2 family transcriptional regulator [Phycisphaerae bacterium]